MKKIAVILAALMLLSVVPLASFAGPLPDYAVYPNDPVVMPKADPVIDGVIDWNEGWSAPAKLDFDTVGFFWRFQAMQMNADLYFAYNDDGIYFAADVTELSFSTGHDQNHENHDFFGNSFVLSTGDGKDVEGDDESEPGSGSQRPAGTYNYGYNGDILTLTLDPSRLCQDGKILYCPWYNIGIFEVTDDENPDPKAYLNTTDGEGQPIEREYQAKVYRSKGNYGDITDRVTTAVTVKDIKEYDAISLEAISKGQSAEEVYGEKPFMSGYVVEMFLPWEIVAEDIDAITYGMSSVTKEELAEKGAEISSAVSYMDRFLDPEQGALDNWGRWIVVCDVNDAGVLGNGSSGTPCDLNGLKLINGDEYEVSNPFEDVVADKWYTDGALYCNQKGYMNGTTNTSFAPSSKVTRAMFATILSKIADADTSAYANVQTKFTDVPTGRWFSAPIAWAVDNGYSSGLGETTFGTNNAVSRQQLATFLNTYARINGIEGAEPADITGYVDYSDVAGWAKDAMAWAVGNGLISGVKAGDNVLLSPKGNATRAQIALIVMNFTQGVAKAEYRAVTSYKISPWINAAGIPVTTISQ